MGVGEAVVHETTVSPGRDDPGGPQQAQRLRDGRLCDPGRGGQVAHAQLTRLEHGVEELGTRRVPEELEHRGDLDEVVLRQGAAAYVAHGLRMDAVVDTVIECDDTLI
jgi:hypothetical protein